MLMFQMDGMRVNPVALYKERVDLRLFIMPGDQILCNGEYATVTKVKVYRAGARNRPSYATVRGDWDALAIETERGTRWFGYPPKTLPRIPVTRKRPLW